MATLWTLGCDADDPQRIAAFWALALGYVLEPGFEGPDNASLVDPDGVGPAIAFLRVPEGKTSKNRMHIDVRVTRDLTGDLTGDSTGDPTGDPADRARLVRAKVRGLVSAGATEVREETYDGELGHVVMLDPEGNEFCVA